MSVKSVVNDFSIQVATVNGSGSQTANSVLLRAIFQMGVPVSGKNLFPSNIAGLPTWFTIRASRDGYLARRRETDVIVVMNPETAAEDVGSVGAGGVIVLNDSIPVPPVPEDRFVYRVPMKSLIEPITTDVRLRRLVTNMIYVGVLGELLGIPEQEVEKALDAQLGKKPKALALNHAAVRAGWEWARQNLTKRDPFRLERMDKTAGKILIDGNTAGALGAMMGGVSVVTWYPITPSSSLVEALIGFLERHRKDEAGRATFAVIQAEDEIAAIGMVLGAGWAGARAMTSTSGPGLSLMAEFCGYGYYAEIPAVIWDIQRIGPSTGLPTRTSQADLQFVYGLSHGDTKHPILLPGSVRECYEFGMKAFDLAERLQTPVFVLSDLDLGMNNWMSDPFPYPEQKWDRGKVLSDEALAKLAKFERYRDVDGDGIPWRTLPGINKDVKGAYFTRGSGHDEAARYTESPETYARNMERLARKFETARKLVPAPDVWEDERAEVGLVAFGSTHWAMVEARDQLRAGGLPTGYLLLKALPFTEHIARFVKKYRRVYVVEQNRDGQMCELVRLELPADAARVRSVRHFTGMPVDARSVTEEILKQEGAPAAERRVAEGVTR
ncbi:MAG: 2-oxoacid:acceptor oxidoreductase subunit alpha [Candidatus Eisenbacteria bacterium]|uniref:2-oxoacid:acceptor oxidoreductase subunit alpha n=1 Tax=Eiseniibacteriota bacterium TaxID=2212470 RepID=A0A538SY89_UNCEI|nr:MAG: 2-oxoacid:acceptor oxidoreductase subunit alpha [Candidatus Eisenbacteria bacterium]